MWEVIRGLVREGTTLLLTTQYLEEADELANDIAVVDHGLIIARGTADELKLQVGGDGSRSSCATGGSAAGQGGAAGRLYGRGHTR